MIQKYDLDSKKNKKSLTAQLTGNVPTTFIKIVSMVFKG